MKVKQKKGTFKLPPEGAHVATLIRITDVGTHYIEKYDQNVRSVRLTFELSNTLEVFREEDGPQPFLIDRQYSMSMGKKSSLRKDIESWLGRKLTEDDFGGKDGDGFDLSELVDTVGQVQVVHVEQEGSVYANVGALMTIPRGVKAKKSRNERWVFDMDDFDAEVYSRLPDFLKETITASAEFAELKAEAQRRKAAKPGGKASAAAPAKGKKPAPRKPADDDLPF